MWKDTLQNQKLGRFTATIISAENNTFVFRSDVRFDIKDTIILLIVSELLVRKTENWEILLASSYKTLEWKWGLKWGL